MEEDEDRLLSFEEVHKKYHEKIFHLILRLTGDRDEVEDLTVETFVNAFRCWDQLSDKTVVSTWLHQIAVNNCKNRFKAREAMRRYGEGNAWRSVLERILLSLSMPERIRKAIDALPEAFRSVLLMAQNEDLTYEEIARITGLSVPAVKTRLHRARSKIRLSLESENPNTYFVEGYGVVTEKFLTPELALDIALSTRIVLRDLPNGKVMQGRMRDGSPVLILDERRGDEKRLSSGLRWASAFIFEDTPGGIALLDEVKTTLLARIDSEDGENESRTPALLLPVGPSPAPGSERTLEEAEEPPRNP